jgi:drug/metabolite transporter (DMT)-like permease
MAEMGIAWLMLPRAEEHLSSSITGLLVAMVPIVGALLARLSGDEEHFTRRQVQGLVLGLVGVALILGINIRGTTVWPIASVLVAVVCLALGPRIVVRHLSDLPGLDVVAASLTITAIVYAPFALTNLPAHLSTEVIGSLVGLALVTTLVGFLIFFALINEIGAVRATVVNFVNPAVAIVLGILLLGEPFTLGLGLGFPLVIAGSVLASHLDSGAATRSSPGLKGL